MPPLCYQGLYHTWTIPACQIQWSHSTIRFEWGVSSVPVEVAPLRQTTPSLLYCLLYLSTHACCICCKIQQTVQYRRVLSSDKWLFRFSLHSNLVVIGKNKDFAHVGHLLDLTLLDFASRLSEDPVLKCVEKLFLAAKKQLKKCKCKCKCKWFCQCVCVCPLLSWNILFSPFNQFFCDSDFSYCEQKLKLCIVMSQIYQIRPNPCALTSQVHFVLFYIVPVMNKI